MVVNNMKWVINTLLSIGMLAIVVLLALVMFNSFMTVAVAHTGRILDKNGVSAGKTGDGVSVAVGESPEDGGTNIGISQSGDGGFVIKTQDGSMKVSGGGIEMPEIPGMGGLM